MIMKESLHLADSDRINILFTLFSGNCINLLVSLYIVSGEAVERCRGVNNQVFSRDAAEIVLLLEFHDLLGFSMKYAKNLWNFS